MCQVEADVYNDLGCHNNGTYHTYNIDWKYFLIIINKCLGGKVLQSITFLWPFGKNLVDKFNPQYSFFPTPKICHIKFDPVFDPSKDIMLGIKGIKYC